MDNVAIYVKGCVCDRSFYAVLVFKSTVRHLTSIKQQRNT